MPFFWPGFAQCRDGIGRNGLLRWRQTDVDKDVGQVQRGLTRGGNAFDIEVAVLEVQVFKIFRAIEIVGFGFWRAKQITNCLEG